MEVAIVRWKPGSRFGVKAETAQTVIEAIRVKNGGTPCDPEMLVDACRPKTHPMHKLFTWDDSTAADNWRRHEARRIIGSIEIVRIDEEKKEPGRIIPAFVAMPTGGYVGTEEAMSDDRSELILDQAMAYLNGFKVRFGRLTEFAKVLSAIDDLQASRVRPKLKKKPQKTTAMAG